MGGIAAVVVRPEERGAGVARDAARARRSRGCATPASRSARCIPRRRACTAARAGRSRAGRGGSRIPTRSFGVDPWRRRGDARAARSHRRPRGAGLLRRVRAECARAPSTARASFWGLHERGGREDGAFLYGVRTDGGLTGTWCSRRRRIRGRGATTCGSTTSSRTTARPRSRCGGSSAGTRCRWSAVQAADRRAAALVVAPRRAGRRHPPREPLDAPHRRRARRDRGAWVPAGVAGTVDRARDRPLTPGATSGVAHRGRRRAGTAVAGRRPARVESRSTSAR